MRLWKQLFSLFWAPVFSSGKWASKYLTDYLWWINEMVMVIVKTLVWSLTQSWCSISGVFSPHSLESFRHYRRKRNSECFTLDNPLIVQTFLESASHHPPVSLHCCRLMLKSLLKYLYSFDSYLGYPEYFSFLFSVGSYHPLTSSLCECQFCEFKDYIYCHWSIAIFFLWVKKRGNTKLIDNQIYGRREF